MLTRRCRLEKGFDAMMSDMRVPDLARLYNLCGRIHALEPLRAAFRAYIKKAGLALIMDEEKVCGGTLLAACYECRQHEAGTSLAGCPDLQH